jgi:hypothetical protein
MVLHIGAHQLLRVSSALQAIRGYNVLTLLFKRFSGEHRFRGGPITSPEIQRYERGRRCRCRHRCRCRWGRILGTAVIYISTTICLGCHTGSNQKKPAQRSGPERGHKRKENEKKEKEQPCTRKKTSHGERDHAPDEGGNHGE